MNSKNHLVKTYTLGDPLGNISELGSDIYDGAEYVGNGIVDGTVAAGDAIGDAAVATGDAIVDTADVVGDAIYDGGVATGEAIEEGYEEMEETASEVKEYIIRSIADWANAQMEQYEETSPVEPEPEVPQLSANEQITENMFEAFDTNKDDQLSWSEWQNFVRVQGG